MENPFWKYLLSCFFMYWNHTSFSRSLINFWWNLKKIYSWMDGWGHFSISCLKMIIKSLDDSKMSWKICVTNDQETFGWSKKKWLLEGRKRHQERFMVRGFVRKSNSKKYGKVLKNLILFDATIELIEFVPTENIQCRSAQL